jgi:signal transduction histidine kinase
MVENAFATLAQQARAVVANDDVQKEVALLASTGASAERKEAAQRSLAQRLATLTEYRQPLGFVVTTLDGAPVLAGGAGTGADLRRFEFKGEAGALRFSLPLLLADGGPSTGGERLAVALKTALVDDRLAPRLQLWLIHDGRSLFSAVLRPGRSGTTGEIYAFDDQGRMLSDSRFNQHLYAAGLIPPGAEAAMRLVVRDPMVNLLRGQALKRSAEDLPLTVAVRGAIADGAGSDVDGFRDYRGVPVVGAWRWLGKYGFGLTHEIDVAEAFLHVRALSAVVGLLIFLLLVATGVSGFLARRAVATESRFKELQNEVAHVNRLATMGEMATGLAHEINQPLAAITNFARATLNEMTGDAPPTTDAIRERLEHIERSALRSGEVIRRLRKFVARREITAVPISVAGMIDDPLRLLASELRGLGVAPVIDIPGGLPQVIGDEVQLQQVMINLLRNSVEAMRKVPGRQHRLAVSAVVENGCVRVDVADSGAGIDDKVKARLFEQFATGSAQGMGLGLAISRTIVEAHGGEIRVSRDRADGVTFTIRLPAADAGAAVG